jgi:hypothetical protein
VPLTACFLRHSAISIGLGRVLGVSHFYFRQHDASDERSLETNLKKAGVVRSGGYTTPRFIHSRDAILAHFRRECRTQRPNLQSSHSQADDCDRGSQQRQTAMAARVVWCDSPGHDGLAVQSRLSTLFFQSLSATGSTILVEFASKRRLLAKYFPRG